MCSRRTLVYLILTLNHAYPDYDFSLLRARHFHKEESVPAVRDVVAAHLVEVAKARASRGQGRERSRGALEYRPAWVAGL